MTVRKVERKVVGVKRKSCRKCRNLSRVTMMPFFIVPARFLSLVSHLCIAITLLWESEQSVRHCLPTQFQGDHFRSFQKQLTGGFSTSIALICIELVTFLTGLTMFSSSSALVSTGCHGLGSLLLIYFVLDMWHCDWFWFIFAACSILPFIFDSPDKWTAILLGAGVATTLGSSLPVGYNIGVVNTPAEIIKQFCNESFVSRYDYTLTDSSLNLLWSVIVSIFVVGGVTGSCLGALVADNMGRKGGIIFTNVISLMGAIFFVVSLPSNSVEMLIIGRLLVGISGGLTTSIVPMYLIELAPLKFRGSMGVMCPMGVTVGVLFGQIMGLDRFLGTPDRWHYLLGLFGLLVVIFTPVLLVLPESPKYLLVIKSDFQRAVKALCRARNKPMSELTPEIADLQSEKNVDSMESFTLGQVLSSPGLRLSLALVCFMQAGQQTSGINAVFYYSTSIFTKANLSLWEAQLATIGAGIINCAMALIAIPLMAFCGRRPLAIISTAFATVCLVALCVLITLIDAHRVMPKLCIAGVLLYVMFYGLGLGPIPYFIGSELFEVGPRPAAMSLGSLCNWGGNFLVAMTFPSLQAAIHAYSFLFFAVSTGLLCAFIYFYLPETKGKSPSEVSAICRNRFK